MAAFYGARFADAWRGVDVAEVKAAWAEELAGYTIPEIQRGIANLKTRAFPPTLPEFLQLCRPKPTYEAAHAEAVKLVGGLDGWSDCSIFWSAREIGYFDLKAIPYERIAGRWREAFDRAWERRSAIPLRENVAGLVTDQTKEPEVFLTDEERQALWNRINSLGKKVTKAPAPISEELRREMEEAEAEIARRAAQ